MPLSKRIFHCPSCGFTEHRDIKSSLYIESRAGLARTYTPVGHNVRPTLLAVVDEAGTITAKPSTSSAVGSPTL